MPIPSPAPADAIATWYNKAEEARRAGHFDTAQTLLDRILAQDPRHAEALYSRGVLLLEWGQLESAQNWVERAIEVRPHPAFYNALYIIQIKLGAFASAAQTAQRGLALQPNAPSLLHSMALTLKAQGRLEDAAIGYRRVLELQPDNAIVHSNLGVLSMDLGALDDALRHLRRAITLAPALLGARANLGHALLAAGCYEEAWPYFEDRWAGGTVPDGHRDPPRPRLPLPQWKGENPDATNRGEGTPVSKARLLVTYEQGYGDCLQFVRYLPLALEHFSQVTFACHPALWRLYEQSLCSRWPGLTLINALPADLSNWDWYCPLMSLPMAFRTRLDNIPAPIPYLYADTGRAAQWQARLATLPNPNLPRVGVVWAGGHSGMEADQVRSMKCSQIAPLLDLPHVRWISLQKTDDPEKLPDTASKARLTDWTDELTDFADTAALIENLDLVISVDTSTAHLAAAMGKPVWLLNRFAGCWRWLRDRDDSPWYPTVRLFTQSQRGNWDEVLERVVAALQQDFSPHHERFQP
jgi:tetratricopeptide (TPR) repeat protein